MGISADVKYTEAMNAIRHYSALRFAMLTIFIAITGGLVSTYTGDANSKLATLFRIDVLRWAGLWVSFAFLAFEIALNRYITRFWMVADNCPGAPVSDGMRPRWLRVMVASAARSLSFGTLVFWIFLPYIKTA
jgi:hypothetical protein